MTKEKNKLTAYISLVFIFIVSALILQYQGRIWFCADGSLYLWVSDAWSDQNSQHISDPYSFSHLLHGILFFGILYKLTPRLSWMWKLNVAVLIEALWEVLENSAMVINRYRDAGALGYSGDSIINSMGDLMSCILGFVLANYLGLKKSVVLFLVIEIVMILTIRDCLIINVIMLIHPVEAIKEWQSFMTS
jgi:hypothetical protein